MTITKSRCIACDQRIEWFPTQKQWMTTDLLLNECQCNDGGPHIPRIVMNLNAVKGREDWYFGLTVRGEIGGEQISQITLHRHADYATIEFTVSPPLVRRASCDGGERDRTVGEMGT